MARWLNPFFSCSVLLSLAASVAAGCGGDDPGPVRTRTTPPAGASSPAATATATSTPTPTPVTTPTPTATASPAADPHGGQEAPDEEVAKRTARFVVGTNGIPDPVEVEVAAFLPVLVVIRNDAPVPVTVRPPEGDPRELDPGDEFRHQDSGLEPGRYPVVSAPGGEGALVVVRGG